MNSLLLVLYYRPNIIGEWLFYGEWSGRNLISIEISIESNLLYYSDLSIFVHFFAYFIGDFILLFHL